jgi:hypothetical protein
MKRRTFIIAATAATVAVAAVPIINYTCNSSKIHDPLTSPDMLSRICDEETLREIGKKYRSMAPAEASKEKLMDLLLTDDGGKKLGATDSKAIVQLLGKKSHNEFAAYNTLVVNGWVISPTEARQCALFSLNAN